METTEQKQNIIEQKQQNKPQQQTKKKCFRRILQALLVVLVIVILLPLTLYIPQIQNAVKNIAVEKVSEATGWEIGIERILLKFPLDLSVDGLLVLDEKRDTMISAENMMVDVKLLPLFVMNVEVNEARLKNGYYHMVSEDSSMVLSANINLLETKPLAIDLSKSELALNDVDLNGGKVTLQYYPERVVPKEQDTTTVEWNITAQRLSIENLEYEMQMLPIISNLKATVKSAVLADAKIDLESAMVHARYFGIDNADVKYFTPTEAEIASVPPAVPDTINVTNEKTQLWTVTSDSVRLTNSQVLYALNGAKPTNGLDMNYLQLTDINIAIDDLYNKGAEIKVPIKHLSAVERSGLKVEDGRGTFSMDKEKMHLDSIQINTMLSEIFVDAQADMTMLDSVAIGGYNLNANAKIDLEEVQKIMPDLRPMLKTIPHSRPIEMSLALTGDEKLMTLSELKASLPKYAEASATGKVDNPLNDNTRGGDINFKGVFSNLNFIKPSVFDAQLSQQVNIPPMTINGKASLHGNDMAGNMQLKLATGEFLGDAKFNSRSEGYAVNADLKQLPLRAILPLSGLGDVTAQFSLQGKGFDVSKPATYLATTFAVDNIEYNNKVYENIRGSVDLDNTTFVAALNSINKGCNFSVTANGVVLQKDRYEYNLNANIEDLDLYSLAITDFECKGKGEISLFGDMNFEKSRYDIVADVNNFKWTIDSTYYYTDNVNAQISTTDSTINVALQNNEFKLNFASPSGIKEFMSQLDKSYKVIEYQAKNLSVNIDTLQAALPKFTLDMDMQKKNLVSQLLEVNGIKMRDFSLSVANDTSIYVNSRISDLKYNDIKIDTITFLAKDVNHYLGYKLHIGNRRGTFDEFARVTLKGGIKGSKLTNLLEQQNIKGEVGYKLGMNAVLTDSAVDVDIFPNTIRVAYRDWTVSEGNKVKYNYAHKHLDADLKMQCDSSIVALQTNHNDYNDQENVNLQIHGVEIADWVNISPFFPPMSGKLDANMSVAVHDSHLVGDGLLSLKNFKYGKETVGDFVLDAKMELDPETRGTKITSNLDVNGSHVVLAYGTMADSTSTNPFEMTLKLDKFPLSTITPFVPDKMVDLQGFIDGELQMKGSPAQPMLNGFVQFESAAAYMPIFGTQLKFPDKKVQMDSNVLKFDKFEMYSLNENPVVMDGIIDINNQSDPYLDLTLRGNEVQFVNAKQSRKSQLFGRGFANLNATMKGRLASVKANANVALLSGSNLTYVLKDMDASDFAQQNNEEMVHFVQFSDTIEHKHEEDVPINGITLNAILEVQEGTTISVYMSENGRDRVQIEGAGRLNYAQNFVGDNSLTGTLTINDGFVRYKPPLISEKTFYFKRGSSVGFRGDITNPVLNIEGEHNQKASVSNETAGSRLVDFIVSIKVGGTLNRMDLSFDLAAKDDMTVKNELQSMSQSQRMSQAINLMLYNAYTGLGASTSSSGNPLYNFLQSQLNTWAASTIKGVDLSFGINQYESMNDASKLATSYSFKLSKSLFNDRFKVSVGGNYNTDAIDNFANDLLSDISLEYLINQAGSMSVKLYRKKSTESVIEGEVSETGAGFVLRRKLSSLKDIFTFDFMKRFRKRFAKMQEKRRAEELLENQTDTTTTNETTENDEK